MAYTKYGKDGERLEPYKQDSTRGSARIEPLNYKGDVLTQVWMDSRILATLIRWMESNGYYPRFMSDIVREPLKIFMETMASAGEVEIVEDTAEARELLNSRFRVDLSRGGRGSRNVLHNQVLSDRRAEIGERLGRGQGYNDVQSPITNRHKTQRWIPLEGYEDVLDPDGNQYIYPEGDELRKSYLIESLKKLGVKSAKERATEAIEQMKQQGLVAEEKKS